MGKVTRGDPKTLKNVRPQIYHHYVRVDEPRALIFVSGQVSRDAAGNTYGRGDMVEQARQAMRNVQTILEAAGASLENVVSTVVYTTDMREFNRINDVRKEFFRDNLPTSTIVEVNHLSQPDLLIEFQVIAAL